jgi:ketosteroid isomerase-like protein
MPCTLKCRTVLISTKKNRGTTMNKSMAWILASALSLGCAFVTQAKEMTGATEKAIAALEEQWAQAERTNNIDLEAPLLAEKFVQIDTDGNVADRAKLLADDKATKYASGEIVDLHITVFGDTAIARYTYNVKGTDPHGKAFDTHHRWTDTWAKMPGGKWQCVASVGSPAKK